MKGYFWNSDGFGDPAKHLAVIEAIREHKLDFIAILETGRANFSPSFLRHLASGLDISWNCLPPHGGSGGILVGFNSFVLTVQTVIAGDFSVKFHLRSKDDGFLWALVVTYGAAQDDKKPRGVMA